MWKKPEINMWGKNPEYKSWFIFNAQQLCIKQSRLYLASEQNYRDGWKRRKKEKKSELGSYRLGASLLAKIYVYGYI